ncbi:MULTISPECIES: tRNA 2-thiocytidine biosynthesis TtcA family protein [unclassified Campylobacter]|uniref:tRNA 2-thiocytidine biosynthesis TtcA family protein n=1 Tax=unclassified Campylobacter TaxID=2593542 RepID=UPI001237ADC4|nr:MULTISPECIES: tRNA 2-thiocytidine biosynthesis TtcA family protein [unclassified Campylobacter]KAA6224611.1 tRNA 2-thiocytidine biosynthesis protein TtcA [Campylobacter sp. LR185c]KAA6224853.1 tRNA 2-thiocytidine biosynthesis protein TtcA [Campylobacter sp. LR286c]KAA6228000.1 tRNA 2-thiocytidine biosynthesis protein TtcA [Campylobacter sp. LR196d]KAA6233481.1 tRNA 2-thiocytidine biosynthesis protein TtcA [Campylobacter sp. LR291e]KAA6234418.1 tRNA 2-thiocytidine biosynthesis protein TtcA [
MINLSKRLIRQVAQANAKFKLIENNDKVLLGLSGGKDSLALAHLLARMQAHAPFNFEFEAVTLSYGMGEDYSHLHKHCEEHGIKHSVLDSNIYEISEESIRKNSSFCSYFSRMRRGALYTYALEKGFNKLAIAHHLDDAAESFFMNFIYNGALRTLAPIYKSKREIIVIRPLIFVRERQLIENANVNNLQVIGNEFCPGMKLSERNVKFPHARAECKELLAKLEQENPKLFTSLKKAFSNIHYESFWTQK